MSRLIKISQNFLTKLNFINSPASLQIVHHSTDSSCDRSNKTKKQTTKKTKTPKGRFDEEYDESPQSYSEKEPLARHPDGVNPITGEVGGPAGPEPTRYGDWERKGRVTDF
ncbi:unnamed protein product [Brachionus calyciflorus]|uniref:Succinate dehydrogenase assembly factor 4, mitochondrial n=1 Tax=Brachionus calyciflorus TaxID=104777 RepID=A0A813P0P9_9BILA|nr:unnamed protein product [Brachionus calyciflorus]